MPQPVVQRGWINMIVRVAAHCYNTPMHLLSGTALLALGTLLFAAGFTFFFGSTAASLFLPQHKADTTYASSRPDTSDPFVLGNFYFNRDENPGLPYDLEKARFYYQQALEENPERHPLAWYQLSRVNFIEGRFGDALFTLSRQLHYFGDEVPNVYYLLGLTHLFLAQQTQHPHDLWRAEQGFVRFLEYSPNSLGAHVDLAAVYFAQGRFEEMLPVLERAFAVAPNNPWVHNMQGAALLNLGDASGALAHFREARRAAEQYTPQLWGTFNQANSPHDWERGLRDFIETIDENIASAARSV